MPVTTVTPNISYIELQDGTHAIDAMYLGGLSVDDIVGSGFTKSIFQTLPAASSQYTNTIGMVPSGSSGEDNIYDEYICVENSGTWSWEKIGSTETTINTVSDTFIKSYPGEEARLTTASITPVGSTETAITGVSVSASANVRDAATTVMTGLGTASKATVPTGITTTTTTVYGTGTTSVAGPGTDIAGILNGATVTNGVLSFTTTTIKSAGADVTVANGTSNTVLSEVSTSGTTQVITAYAGETTSIYPAADITAVTGITSTSSNFAKAGTAMTVATGATSPTSSTTNVGSQVLVGLGTPVAGTAITSVNSGPTLLGTTWKFSSSFVTDYFTEETSFDISGYISEAPLNFTSLHVSVESTGTEYYNDFTFSNDTVNKVFSLFPDRNPYWKYTDDYDTSYDLETGLTVRIDGGTDVQNSDLIHIFETYGTKVTS